MAFIWKGRDYISYNTWVFWFSVLGFIINAGAILLLIFCPLVKDCKELGF